MQNSKLFLSSNKMLWQDLNASEYKFPRVWVFPPFGMKSKSNLLGKVLMGLWVLLMVRAPCLPSEDGCWGIKQFYSCLQPLYPHSLLGKKFSNMVSNFKNNGSFRNTVIRLLVAKGEGTGGGMEQEVGVSRCKLLCVEWINNKILLYGTKNYIPYPMINHNREEY